MINWEELANYLVDRNCDIHSIQDTIYTLFDFGLDRDEIESLGFDRDEINDLYVLYMTQV